jgi:CrcB protein
MNRFWLIAIGAVLGANARYWLGLWAADRFGVTFPYGTLLVNVTGCFLLGFLATLTTGRFVISPEVRLLIAVGFFGSFTTFSSFAVETMALAQGGAFWRSLLNVLANNGIGLSAAWLGIATARLFG